MRSLITLGVLSLVGASALMACGDDDGTRPGTTAGTGGVAGRAGAGGASGGAAGVAGRAGGGGAINGGGAGGAAPVAVAPTGPCVGALEGGCARLFVPATATGNTEFEIDLGAAGVDLSASVVTVRLKALGTTPGAIQVYAKNGAAQGFANYYVGYRTVATTLDWTTIAIDLAACEGSAAADAGVVAAVDAGDAGGPVACGNAGTVAGVSVPFDKSAVRWIGIQAVLPAGTTAAITTIDVDSITFAPNPPANVTFATTVEGVTPNAFSTPPPPAGTTVTFAAPAP
jgi:hypothetical protein